MTSRPTPIVPGPCQESVWDYPRPPRLEPTAAHIRIVVAGRVIADTRTALRVLETSHPPTYYLPPADIAMRHLTPTANGSYCEWKGQASYYTLTVGDRSLVDVAWTYRTPTPPFEALVDHIAFYAASMDEVTVDGEIVMPQPGGFYGGWVTSNVVGPFKGSPGSRGW